jgi:chorismate mutase
VIRVMVHFYAPGGNAPTHVYLGATRSLRSDLHAAQ